MGSPSNWAADGPTGSYGALQGLDSLSSLKGREVTFRWGQKEAKMFFQNLVVTPREQVVGNSTVEEQTTPIVVDVTLTLLQSDREEQWL